MILSAFWDGIRYRMFLLYTGLACPFPSPWAELASLVITLCSNTRLLVAALYLTIANLGPVLIPGYWSCGKHRLAGCKTTSATKDRAGEEATSGTGCAARVCRYIKERSTLGTCPRVTESRGDSEASHCGPPVSLAATNWRDNCRWMEQWQCLFRKIFRPLEEGLWEAIGREDIGAESKSKSKSKSK